VDWMREAVTWAANGGSSGYNVDPKRIMVGGYSCGGTEAYAFINDDRVASIGIFNSGLLSNYDSARAIRKPVLFALGGSSDIAYGNVSTDLLDYQMPYSLHLIDRMFNFRANVTTAIFLLAHPLGRVTSIVLATAARTASITAGFMLRRQSNGFNGFSKTIRTQLLTSRTATLPLPTDGLML
jgi:hypothetical protein